MKEFERKIKNMERSEREEKMETEWIIGRDSLGERE